MENSHSDMAKQVALAACEFERRRTGNSPKSVTVVFSENTLVVTLHGALSPAELALAKSPSAPPKCRSSIANCSTTRPTRFGTKSNESPAWTSAKPRSKSNRRLAPS